jgi:phage gp36-like protein
MYASIDDLKDVLSEREMAELTNDVVDGDEPVENILASAINRAGSVTNSYLAKRYDIPLPTVPESIRDATVTIAKYKLLARRSFISEELKFEYGEVIKWLKDLASGVVELPEIEVPEKDEVAYHGNSDRMNTWINKQIF